MQRVGGHSTNAALADLFGVTVGKIDYYDKSLTRHCPDPADPAVTERVITLMLAAEH